MSDSTSTITFSERSRELRQSGIRAASVRCAELGGINLGQGVCDIPADERIKQAAADAIFANKNLYAAHEGVFALREKLADKIQQFNRVKVDPHHQILVSHGATGAFVCAAEVLFNPGDEVILFEPFYGYHRHLLEIIGVSVATVPMSETDFSIDFARLATAITPKTRGIVICTPCNPSGKVFSHEELTQIGELARKYNLQIITDEIYEYITYPGYQHISIAALQDFAERTITISGFSKTYNITGWRLGYAYGPAPLIEKMALVHDLFYICPPTPLQHGMLAALALDQHYYEAMRKGFLGKRDLLVNGLRELGFTMQVPQGAYYIMADFRNTGLADNDVQAASLLLEQAKVATVPGTAFYNKQSPVGRTQLRFCFALAEEKLQMALEQLKAFFR